MPFGFDCLAYGLQTKLGVLIPPRMAILKEQKNGTETFDFLWLKMPFRADSSPDVLWQTFEMRTTS